MRKLAIIDDSFFHPESLEKADILESRISLLLLEVTTRFKAVILNMETKMERKFTLEYWVDDGWFVGRLKEIPGVFSQGADLAELEENIRDAYHMVAGFHDDFIPPVNVQQKELSVQV